MTLSFGRKAAIPILFLGVVLSQYFYDARQAKNPGISISLSPRLVKSFDLGLNSALASFLWIDTRLELPYFPEGYQKFFDDFNLINALDPRFSTPYVFAEIVLPGTDYPQRIAAAVEIGKKGLENGASDWRIPFWLAATYHLYLSDHASAAKYFDLAARTPGIPEIVRRFAINYGIFPDIREETRQIWLAIYESATDEATKARAKAYVVHYDILEELQKAVNDYRGIYGKYPADIKELADKKIIGGIPQDPFGFEFAVYGGGIVGIKQLPGIQ